MNDYPNNEVLMAVINAIDETKADKIEIQDKIDEIENDILKKTQVQIIETNETEDLSVLKIYKLTQEEYEEALKNNTIDENALYLTPDEETSSNESISEERINEICVFDENDIIE